MRQRSINALDALIRTARIRKRESCAIAKMTARCAP